MSALRRGIVSGVRGPRRNEPIPRSLVIGTAVLAVAFVGMDVLALLTQPPDPLPEALAAAAAVVLMALTVWYLRHNRGIAQS